MPKRDAAASGTACKLSRASVPGGGADPRRRRQGHRTYADYTRDEQRRAYCVTVGGYSLALMAVLIFAALVMRGL